MFTRPEHENQIQRLITLPKDAQIKAIQEINAKNLLELYPITLDQHRRLAQQTRGLQRECWNILNEAIDLNNSSLVMEKAKEHTDERGNEFLQKYNQWKIVNEKEKSLCDLLLQMNPVYEKCKSIEIENEEQRSRRGIFRNHHQDGTYTDEISFVLEVYDFDELNKKYGQNGNRFNFIVKNDKGIICTAHLVNDCSAQWSEDKNIIHYQGSRPVYPCRP